MQTWVGPVALGEISEGLTSLRLLNEDRRGEMKSSLRQHGQLTTLLCCRIQGGIEVVNGFKRLRGARQLGWKELEVEIREATEWARVRLLLFQSHQSDGLSELEQAWVIRALYREDHLTQAQIARLLERDKSWVCRRLALAEGLSSGVEADVRLGLLGLRSTLEISRLPRGNQDGCARVVVQRGLTTRQTSKLVDALLAATDEGERAAILTRTEEGDLNSPVGVRRGRNLSHGEWLSVESAVVKRHAVRLHTRIRQRSLDSLGVEAAASARQTLRELAAVLKPLCRTLDDVSLARDANTHA
jgi:ParB/RepB/Spo0J family partition protein